MSPKHLSSANGFKNPFLPSFNPPPSPCQLVSPSSSLLTSTFYSFNLLLLSFTAGCLSSGFSAIIQCNFFIHLPLPAHFIFSYHPSFKVSLSSPFSVFTPSDTSNILSVCPLCTHAHKYRYVHHPISRQCDLQCSHKIPIDLCIQIVCMCVCIHCFHHLSQCHMLASFPSQSEPARADIVCMFVCVFVLAKTIVIEMERVFHHHSSTCTIIWSPIEFVGNLAIQVVEIRIGQALIGR